VEKQSVVKESQVQFDFFGEPVTFSGLTQSNTATSIKAMAAVDSFQLAVVTKGLTCYGGGEEAGLETQSIHAVAMSWTEALRFTTVWNQANTKQSAPMLAVISVAPVLAQAGTAYVKHLDTLLKNTKPVAPGFPIVQMYDTAQRAASAMNAIHLNDRERLHLRALAYLLKDEHATALAVLLRLLRTCPGDVLALSLAMDIAHTIGDKKAASRASGSVAAYWHERRGGLIRPSLPGHSIAESLIALGFAVNGRHEEAELMATQAMKRGRKVCGGLATWVQAYVFDAGGRTAEGISALANGDGIANYEGCGLLFFESHLGGYGARFALDREERGRGKSQALRLYEANFERVLHYSGFGEGRPWKTPQQKAPLGWIKQTPIGSGDDSASKDKGSFLQNLFSATNKNANEEEYEIILKGENSPSRKVEGWEPTCEDVLTWIPPTPKLLSDATLLLWRFTLNGTMSAKNGRWENMRNAWIALIDIERKHRDSPPLQFCPIASLASSMLVDPADTGAEYVGNGRLARGLYKMGTLLKLGRTTDGPVESTAIREPIAERDPEFWLPVNSELQKEWKDVVDSLTSALDGYIYPSDEEDSLANVMDTNNRLEAWDFEARPILEHAIVYASCKAGDIESLSVARSICSQGVTLRASSPEEWWRYSIVLGLLGDEIASEDALYTSINVGGGQGSRA
jgi:hypothetical protein